MQAVVIREVGAFELADLPVPEPGPGEALIRVSVAGLCRTDLKIVRHGHRDLTLPRVPGEEVVGEIVRLGPEGPAAARPAGAADPAPSLAPGDRVYVYPGVWCGECPSCRRGAENLCRQMRIMGFHRDGGFAEYVAAPLQSLIRVPQGLGYFLQCTCTRSCNGSMDHSALSHEWYFILGNKFTGVRQLIHGSIRSLSFQDLIAVKDMF